MMSRISRLLPGIGAGQALLILAALGLIWGLLIGNLLQSYRDSLAGARRETSSLASGLSETTVATFDMVDQNLKDLRAAYQRDPAHFDVKQWVAERGLRTGLIIQASLVDRDGIIFQSNLPMQGRVSIAARQHFRVQRDSAADDIFISEPVLGFVSKRKSLNVTRKIIGPDGQFDGVVVVSVGLDYLNRFFQGLSSNGLIELIGKNDGIVRARAPADMDRIGERKPGFELIQKGSGSLRTDGAPFHVDRIVSYQAVENYPLIVVAALNARAVFADYRRDLFRYLAGGGLLTALFLGLGELLRRQRQSLLEGRAALKATLENISQGVMMIDGAGNIPVMNERAVALLGLPHTLIGEAVRFEDILKHQISSGEFAPASQSNPTFNKLLDAGGFLPEFSVYERERPSGTVLEIRTQPLPGGGAVRTFTDVTSRRRHAAVLAAARDAAEAGSRSRTEFIAMMSHEIRTPLNGVLGVAELLRGLDLDPTAAEYVRMIQSSGRHLLHLINNILDFSRLDAGRIELESSTFDLLDLIEQTVEMLHPQATAKGLLMTVALAPDVPRGVVGDAHRLRQILLNLIGNAIKFTERGYVRTSVAKVSKTPQGLRLAFEVADSGIGIDAETKEKLFNAFTQADSSISRRFGGSGLGLTISQRLVTLMGGTISVDSNPGEGTRFHFELILREAVDTNLDAPPSRTALEPSNLDALDVSFPQPAALPAPPKSAGHSGRRILLAEDNATNRLIAQRMLENLGYAVTAVEDGQEALESVAAGDYDLVLMDMMMPHMDGLAATEAIRACQGHVASIPIVGLTANATESDRQSCLAAGMNDFVTKPVSAKQLDAAICRLLD